MHTVRDLCHKPKKEKEKDAFTAAVLPQPLEVLYYKGDYFWNSDHGPVNCTATGQVS
jgi:hypothetical protein